MSKRTKLAFQKTLNDMCKQCSSQTECNQEIASLEGKVELGVFGVTTIGGGAGGVALGGLNAGGAFLGIVGGMGGGYIGANLANPIAEFVGEKVTEHRQKTCFKELGEEK